MRFRIWLVGPLFILVALAIPARAGADVVLSCECNRDCTQFRPEAVCYKESGQEYGRCCPGSSGGTCPSDPGEGVVCDTNRDAGGDAETADTSSTHDTTDDSADGGLRWETPDSSSNSGGCGCNQTSGFGGLPYVFALVVILVGLRIRARSEPRPGE